MNLQWQNFPYGRRGEFVDVSDLGRYAVQPEVKGSRTWRAFLNGKPTAYRGSRDECKAAVQRAVNQQRVVAAKEIVDPAVG